MSAPHPEGAGMEERALLTVITVVKNGLKHLKHTYESLERQSMQDFTWLVLDGLSTDGTAEWVKTVKRSRFRFVSGKDKSIYDAMNKAIGLVETEYCVFLNAGDAFFDDSVTARVCEVLAAKSPPLAYGRYVIQESPGFPARERGRPFHNRADLFLGKIPCHQATYISTAAFRKVGTFNDRMKVYSDREWLMRLAAAYPCESMVFMEFPVVNYDPSGYSYHNFFKTSPEYIRMVFAQGNPLEIAFGMAEWAKMTAYICLSRVARKLHVKRG